MSLFGETQAPRWLSNPESSLLNKEEGRRAAGSFNEAFQAAAGREQQARLKAEDEQRQVQQQQVQQQQTLTALQPVAEAMKGVNSFEGFTQVVSQHPEWMLNPQTAPYMNNAAKTWLDSEKVKTTAQKAEAASIAGKVAIQNTTDFVKGLAELGKDDPQAQAAIIGMTPGPNGVPSAMQWQEYGLARDAVAQKKKNAAMQAEIEAKQGGALLTTTITDKGVSKKFSPPAADKSRVALEPQTKILPDGTTLAWIPGGSTIHVLKPSGQQSELTLDQATKALNALKNSEDEPTKKVLSDSIKQIVNQKKNKTFVPPEGWSFTSGSSDWLKPSGTGAAVSNAPTPTQSQSKALTPDIADQYLQKAKGDRSAAEKMARDDGYTW